MTASANILVVDDDPLVLKSLSEYLRLEQYAVATAASREEAVARLEKASFHVALVDVRLPEGSGFDVLDYARRHNLSTAIIVLTGYGSIEDAVRAVKNGAFDYITKPVADEEVKLAIERALAQQELVEENKRLRRQLNAAFDFDSIVCHDVKMRRALDRVKVVAGTDTTVLITGESGTGKTIVAQALHCHSPRADKPFVEVSCGALPDTLLESELFGHVKGAFSGAITDKSGKFDAADKGTIFLDEISLASVSLQTKLLRVLESLRFEPVGSNRTRKVDVRLILATNEDLAELVKQGKFREDLYYRINVVNLHLPPLRERVDDIAPLAQHFVKKYRHLAAHPVEGLSEDALRLLTEYDWPGNVRELENVIQRAVVLCHGHRVEAEDIEVRPRRADEPLLPTGEVLPLKEAMKQIERRLIVNCLKACEGNRKEAARRLKINRTTLYNKLHEHGIMEV